MNTPPCPDCENGWRYADEIQNSHILSGLARCPTCNGKGSLGKAAPNQRLHDADVIGEKRHNISSE